MTEEPRRIDDDWEAIVYDLDGTIVGLAIDWDEVTAAVREAFAERGIDTGGDLWELLERASAVGLHDRVEAILAEYEREGARRSSRLPLADRLIEESRPTAICSLNCEEACRVALETHGLDSHVDRVIGRDSVASPKPDPEPLMAAAEALETAPDRTLFVGDTDRDAITAERAGTGFLDVRNLP